MPFKPGESGNPGGRKKTPNEVLALARKWAPDAIKRLAELIQSTNEKVAVQASSAILDRAYGKPVQSTEISGADGGALEVIVNIVGSKK